LKKALLGTAAIAAAVVVFAAVTVPPRRQALAAASDGTIAGIVHVHSIRSDGRGTPDDIAAAAARAGLKFLVFTDHGDATRPPDRPSYRSGVLCLDGVEVSTTGGHYVALDMGAAPYPLGGEARDVVEDVKRLGGFGVVAHPDSPKPELRWREWTAPFDALETLNPDTSWRRAMQMPGWRPKLRLLEALIDYPVRPAETMARLLQPSETMFQWNALAHRRRIVLLAGADAHANLGVRGGADPGDTRYSLPLPGYESTFRTLSIHVRPDRPLSGDAAADAAMLVRAIRSGHLYTVVDGLATPPFFDLTASNSHGVVHAGDELGVGGPVTLRVQSNAPPDFTTTIFGGSRVLMTDRHEQTFTFEAPENPEVYRVEIRPDGRAVPWVVSNAIYVRPSAPAGKLPVRPPATASVSLFDGQTTKGWQTETDGRSLAALEVSTGLSGPELRFRYALAADRPSGEFVAISSAASNGLEPNNRLAFTVRAERPMRISVQLRNGKPESERWLRSVYVDTFAQQRTVFFDDLTPVGVTSTWSPTLSEIRSVVFAIDTTNTKPGTAGRVWISNVSLQR
jgi:hypothetical protein